MAKQRRTPTHHNNHGIGASTDYPSDDECKLSRSASPVSRGVTMGGARGTFPLESNLYGGAE